MFWKLFVEHLRAAQRVFGIAFWGLYGGRHNIYRKEIWAIGRTVFCETKKIGPTAGADRKDKNSQSSPANFSSLGLGS